MRRTLGVIAVCLSMSCVSEPEGPVGTIEEAQLLCELQQDNPRGCTRDCLSDAYFDAIEGPCAEEDDTLFALTSEREIYLDCAFECPTSVICEDSIYTLTDCGCVAQCASMRSVEFQNAWINKELCVSNATARVCRG